MGLGIRKMAHPRQSHPSPSDFTPVRDQLSSAVLHSTPVKPEDFTLALFTPNIVIDTSGSVLVLSAADYDGLVSLAKRTWIYSSWTFVASNLF
jgi:hypothetical protein